MVFICPSYDQGSVALSFLKCDTTPSERYRADKEKGCDIHAKQELRSGRGKQSFLKEGLNEPILKGER